MPKLSNSVYKIQTTKPAQIAPALLFYQIRLNYTEKLSPQPHVRLALGLLK